MPSKVVELGVRVTSDVAGVADDADRVARSFDGMTDSVRRAGDTADDATRRMGSVADSADNLDDKAGKATGALGALSSGMELVGADKYAGALQGAALATDFFSGVGQAANLVLESGAVKWIRNTAAMVGNKVATVATTAATKAAAAGQWALNIAMNASPVGLLVAGVLAVVAALVLLYRRSETFRAIVHAVMRAAAVAVGWVVDAVSGLVRWIRDKAPAAWHRLVDVTRAIVGRIVGFVVNLVSRYVAIWGRILSFGAAILGRLRDVVSNVVGRIVDFFKAIPDKVSGVWDRIKSGFTTVRDKIVGLAGAIRDKVVGAFDAAKAPIQWVIDKIQWLLDHGGKLLGHVFGKSTVVDSTSSTFTDPTAPADLVVVNGKAAGTTQVVFNFPNAVVTDQSGLARLVESTLVDYFRRYGR